MNPNEKQWVVPTRSVYLQKVNNIYFYTVPVYNKMAKKYLPVPVLCQ